MAFQLFRGTGDKVATYNGAIGEVVYNMDNQSLHIFDGVTAGGFELKNAEAMKQEILSGASTAYDTLKEIEDYITANQGSMGSLLTDLGAKAPKPSSPTPNGQALSWDGSAFQNVSVGATGFTRQEVNGNVEFVFA
jgi:hypothetical protein